MPIITPTPEQQVCIDAFATGHDLVIEAGAGTGKTSTLLMLANTAEVRGLYLAYNKAIATEAGHRFPPHVPASTAHSLAYRALGHQYRDRLNGDRLSLRQVASFLGIEQVYVEDRKRLGTGTLARLALEMVGRFCQTADTQVELHHRPYVEGIADLDGLGEALLPFARKAWDDLQLVRGGRLRFSHDHYLKMWQLTDPRIPADFILFDEAQDADPCIASIVARHVGQRIYVGDRAQSIYGWRGAVDAMDIPEVDVAWLSQSFRFGEEIAAEANRWLPQIGTSLRLTGNPALASQIVDGRSRENATGDARAVLCRTNGMAFKTLVEAQGRDIKAFLQGGGNDILAFCRGADELKSRGSSTHRDLVAFSTWLEVQEYVEEDKSASDLRVLVDLVDAYGTARVTTAVQTMYPDEETAELTISTAHKAKGREWDSVRIAGDFTDRTDNDGLPIAPTKEELMLRYVAVTRAKMALDRGPLAPNYRREPPPIDMGFMSLSAEVQDEAQAGLR